MQYSHLESFDKKCHLYLYFKIFWIFSQDIKSFPVAEKLTEINGKKNAKTNFDFNALCSSTPHKF